MFRKLQQSICMSIIWKTVLPMVQLINLAATIFDLYVFLFFEYIILISKDISSLRNQIRLIAMYLFNLLNTMRHYSGFRRCHLTLRRTTIANHSTDSFVLLHTFFLQRSITVLTPSRAI